MLYTSVWSLFICRKLGMARCEIYNAYTTGHVPRSAYSYLSRGPGGCSD